MQANLSSIAVLIPAWQPDERLVTLVHSLAEYDFAAIVIVDDGSRKDCQILFKQLEAIPSVHVLQHEENRGQGRAFKTALSFTLDAFPDLLGVVTADADGQHAVPDIIRIAEALTESKGRPILGVRSFGAEVPLRSRFGNILTRYIFRFLSGYDIRDTQSGLRGFPKQYIPALILLDGERYEYATSVLSYFCKIGAAPVEVPIATIYVDNNRASHFNPLRDSVRIYILLLRCFAPSYFCRARKCGCKGSQ
jgi:glycosyltransferase involved in cell wall biosynthesis